MIQNQGITWEDLSAQQIPPISLRDLENMREYLQTAPPITPELFSTPAYETYHPLRGTTTNMLVIDESDTMDAVRYAATDSISTINQSSQIEEDSI